MSTFQYHPNWQFADSEEALSFYILNDVGFQKQPNEAFPRMSHQSKVSVLHAEQRLWEQVGVRKEFMDAVRSEWDIPIEFWRQVWTPDVAGFMRHCTIDNEQPIAGNRLKSISIGFRWPPGWKGYVNFFAHYHIASSRMLLFIRQRGDHGQRRLLELLNAHARLSQQPLEALGIVLMAGYETMVPELMKYGASINTMELSLGVTADAHHLQTLGYAKSKRSLKENNEFLYSLQRRIAAHGRCHGYLTSICKHYLDLAAHLQDQYNYDIPDEDVQEIAQRLSMDTSYLVYLDKMIQTQFTVLYNMILREDTKVSISIAEISKSIAEGARKDSSAMKTIAYLTLAFLPTAIVSSIFSTTILDFQNWSSNGNTPRVVSSGWWVYALTCGIATAITLLVYFWWPAKWNPASNRHVPDEERAEVQNGNDEACEMQIRRPLAEEIVFDEGFC